MMLGLKSRSRRVVQDSSITGIDRSKSDTRKSHTAENLKEICCYWSNLPPELLREVLMRIEASESKWPLRKHVVACAGVCRTWREVIKELVKVPEISGRITFPISVKQPGPRESMFQCFIKRNRDTQAYHLFASLSQALSDDGKFLLAARKCRRATCTDYIISLHANDMQRGRSAYVGKLRSNFLGTKFIVYDALSLDSEPKMSNGQTTRSKQTYPQATTGNYPVAHISYELNVLGARGPRRMHCIMDVIPASAIRLGGVAPTQIYFPSTSVDSYPSFPFFSSKSNCMDKTSFGSSSTRGDGSLILRNKAPRWHQQLQCWCLNFHGRVTVASVKNFQLVASPENGQVGPQHDKVILQFGKVGKDVFTMDFRFPISAFQAFAICLSNFDTKIACE
ncbi:phosphoric diester hydrolase [Dorcoceras hygrometricum]|uniref:Phosphoric diester hydrolase n=1 Tax=Dorcoceras hygrometricum TaxID=472368 RepID=A0A2Z7B3Y9_9LAMI|nr:phosphoric diester hydrolase [Dorcoceras hygrometricum]